MQCTIKMINDVTHLMAVSRKWQLVAITWQLFLGVPDMELTTHSAARVNMHSLWTCTEH